MNVFKNYLRKKELETILEYAVFLYSEKKEIMFLPSSPDYEAEKDKSKIEEVLSPKGLEYRNKKTIHRVPNEIYLLKNKIIKDFDLSEYKATVDIFFNRLLSGESLPSHSHAKHPMGVDLRFNLMIKKCGLSGNPIVKGKTIEVEDGDLWVFNGCEEHGTEVSQGDRYILSYGFIVPFDSIDPSKTRMSLSEENCN